MVLRSLNLCLIVHVYGQLCGDVYTVGKGVISSPRDQTGSYYNDIVCEWTLGLAESLVVITVGKGMSILLQKRSITSDAIF